MVDFPPQPSEPTAGVPGWYRHDTVPGMVRYWDGAAWSRVTADDPAIPGYGIPHPTQLDDDPSNDDPDQIVGDEPDPDPYDNKWERRREREVIRAAERIDPAFAAEVDADERSLLERLNPFADK